MRRPAGVRRHGDIHLCASAWLREKEASDYETGAAHTGGHSVHRLALFKLSNMISNEHVHVLCSFLRCCMIHIRFFTHAVLIGRQTTFARILSVKLLRDDTMVIIGCQEMLAEFLSYSIRPSKLPTSSSSTMQNHECGPKNLGPQSFWLEFVNMCQEWAETG